MAGAPVDEVEAIPGLQLGQHKWLPGRGWGWGGAKGHHQGTWGHCWAHTWQQGHTKPAQRGTLPDGINVRHSLCGDTVSEHTHACNTVPCMKTHTQTQVPEQAHARA